LDAPDARGTREAPCGHVSDHVQKSRYFIMYEVTLYVRSDIMYLQVFFSESMTIVRGLTGKQAHVE
jgi:hypothetical protein